MGGHEGDAPLCVPSNRLDGLHLNCGDSPGTRLWGVFFRLLLTLGLAVVSPNVCFSKPAPTPEIVPTIVRPMKFRIPVGGEVDILLVAAGHREGTIYEVKSRPRLGFLEPVRHTSDGRGRIRYRHDPAKGGGSDSFFYRAQNPGCTPSVRESISIEIYQTPAVLDCSLGDFPPTNVGANSTATLVIRNVGGSRYSGTLEASPPWRVEKKDIGLNPGESEAIGIEFFPDKEEVHYGTLHLVGEPSKSFRLQAEGTAPFHSNPALLRLRGDGAGKRSAVLRLSNASYGKLELEFNTPSGILPIPSLAIETGMQAEVEILADPASPGASSGRLEVVKDFFKKPIRFEVEPLPAKLEFTPGRDLVFPDCASGESSQVDLEIANLGGEECNLSLKPPQWIRAERLNVSVAPGQRASIALTAFPSGNGTLREPIVLESTLGQIEPLVASVTILEKTPVEKRPSESFEPESPPLVDGRRIAREALRIHSISTEGGEVRIRWSDPLPGRFEYLLHWLEITSSSVLAMENSSISEAGTEKFSPEKFASERLRHREAIETPLENDRVVKRWMLLRSAKINELPEGLRELVFPVPKDRYSIKVRISRVLGDGSISPTRTEIRIPLAPQKSNSFPLWGVLLITALVLASSVLATRLWASRKLTS